MWINITGAIFLVSNFYLPFLVPQKKWLLTLIFEVFIFKIIFYVMKTIVKVLSTLHLQKWRRKLVKITPVKIFWNNLVEVLMIFFTLSIIQASSILYAILRKNKYFIIYCKEEAKNWHLVPKLVQVQVKVTIHFPSRMWRQRASAN